MTVSILKRTERVQEGMKVIRGALKECRKERKCLKENEIVEEGIEGFDEGMKGFRGGMKGVGGRNEGVWKS